LSSLIRLSPQAKADLQRSNSARDTLEQAVEEMKRELIAASAASAERAALQNEVRTARPRSLFLPEQKPRSLFLPEQKPR
jgi:hypothetical protein